MTTTLAAGALLGTTIPAAVMAQDNGDGDLDDDIAELVEALRALIGDELGDRVVSFVITLDNGELSVSPVTVPGSTPTSTSTSTPSTTPTSTSTVPDDDGPGDDDDDSGDDDDDSGDDDDGSGDDDDGPGDDD